MWLGRMVWGLYRVPFIYGVVSKVGWLSHDLPYCQHHVLVNSPSSYKNHALFESPAVILHHTVLRNNACPINSMKGWLVDLRGWDLRKGGNLISTPEYINLNKICT